MDKQEYGFFEPRNPMFLSFAKWIVIVTSGFLALIGLISLGDFPGYGFLLLIGAVIYYFSGMVFVNMLYNIRDIKLNTQKTNEILESLGKKEINW